VVLMDDIRFALSKNETRFDAYMIEWPLVFDPVFRFPMVPPRWERAKLVKPAKAWCKEQFGPPFDELLGENSKWFMANESGQIVFRCPALATAFRLRWT
jgi:hypothetical protein